MGSLCRRHCMQSSRCPKNVLVNLFFGPMGFLGSSSMSLCVYFILVIMQGTKSRVSMFL